MDHKLKGKWHSYTLNVLADGSAVLQPDGADNIMDLTQMKENGDVDDGSHNGHKLKGKATSSGSSYSITLDHTDGPKRHYQGSLVRDYSLPGVGQVMVIVGSVLFPHAFAADEKRTAPTGQDEGTWVIVK